MTVTIIIGKNFGDEGKGLAVDYFAAEAETSGMKTACVRHNGGAQAGHTVDLRDGRRFVFSQFSSGSFRGADTVWADSFLPDLWKLSEEAERFRACGGMIPRIFAAENCRCTYIGDVLVNMLLETRRGADRHGSCGMGIHEAALRSEQFPLYLRDAAGSDAETLYRRLLFLHENYLPRRLSALQIDLKQAGEYGELLQSRTVLRNAAEEMCRGAELVQIREQAHLRDYDRVIFEGAQGLLLDAKYEKYAPHLTFSRTGLTEPARILRSIFGGALPETEIVYVSRSYVTRHGAGPLPYANDAAPYDYAKDDRTNVRNEWQGTLRAAPHGSPEEFTEAVIADLDAERLPAAVSLLLTHLHSADGCIRSVSGNIPAEAYCGNEAVRRVFSRVYGSAVPFSEGVQIFPEVDK